VTYEERLRVPSTRGAPCRSCGLCAGECGRVFQITGEWCCPSCRASGALAAHVEPDLEQAGIEFYERMADDRDT
jgi:hypothetical protein